MKRLHYLLICLIITIQICNGQNTPKKEIYNQEFDWTLTIPDDFRAVGEFEHAKIQNQANEVLEKANGVKIVGRSNTVFIYRNDQYNLFSSNYQPYDSTVFVDYSARCKIVNNIVYGTFMKQEAVVKIDSSTCIERIDNLEFHALKMKIIFSHDLIINVVVFSRLFDKNDLTVSIMYEDNKKGKQMLDAFRNSKFGK